MAHLFRAGPGGLADQRVGDVASTVGAGIEALHDYATRFVPAAALGVIGPVVVLVAIALLDPWSTPVLLFTGPMLVLLLAVIGGRTRALTRRRFDELGWLSSFYLDMIRGLATLKAFRRSSEGGDTIEAVSRRYGDATMDVLRTAFQTSLVMEWAATAATALVAVQVSFRMIESDLPFGTALAVLVLTPEFFVPFRRLALEYHSGQAGRAALERIEELTDASTPEPPRPDPTPPPPTPPRASASSAPHRSTRRGAPAIELVDVTFTYPGSPRPALDRLDLHLAAGATVALVGPSGAGKTTVARLVMRFVEPTAGRILVDGRPITDVESATWRRGVAWVPQDPALIAGTIADNIRLGAPDAPLDAGARRGRRGEGHGLRRAAPRRLRHRARRGGPAPQRRPAATPRDRPGRAAATRPSWCSTSPRPTSTTPPRPRCSPRSPSCWGVGPPSSSRTGRRPSRLPTAW